MSKFMTMFIFLFLSFAAHAEIITVACPEAKDIRFVSNANGYDATAWAQVKRGELPPFIMRGTSVVNTVGSLVEAQHKKGSFQCVYASSTGTKALALINDPTFGLDYCHFVHVGPNTHACRGDENHCELSCDAL